MSIFNILRVIGLSGLWIIQSSISAQPGNRGKNATATLSAKPAAYSGTMGYLYPAQKISSGLNKQGRSIYTFRDAANFPFEPLGSAFLVAPDLLLSAGSLLDWYKSMDMVWIPVPYLKQQIPDTSVFLVSSVKAYAHTGVRGGDENFMLLQLERKTALPSFALNFAPINPRRDLRCCMDDGTLQPLSVETDEGIRSLFVAEQFPKACLGSAVVDEQGRAVGILIPGPYAGTLGDSEQDTRLFGNAVQKLATLPTEVLRVLFVAALKQALYLPKNPDLMSWIPYLQLLCGSGSDMLTVAAKTGNERLLDTLLSMSCTKSCLDVNQRDEAGDALLHVLLQRKNYKALNRLFGCPGLSINVQDGKGRTALHQAVYSGELAQVELLLKHGANMHIRDKQGETPLFEAVRSGNVSMCRVLLAHAAWEVLSLIEKKQIKDLVKANEDKKLRHLFKKYL